MPDFHAEGDNEVLEMVQRIKASSLFYPRATLSAELGLGGWDPWSLNRLRVSVRISVNHVCKHHNKVQAAPILNMTTKVRGKLPRQPRNCCSAFSFFVLHILGGSPIDAQRLRGHSVGVISTTPGNSQGQTQPCWASHMQVLSSNNFDLNPSHSLHRYFYFIVCLGFF